MSAEMAQKLVQGGIKAVRNGDHDLARKAFTQALKLDPNNEAAWLGMATITEGDADKSRILKRVLDINPDNTRAQEALRRIEAASAPPEPEPEPEPISEPEPIMEEEPEPSEGMVASDLFADEEDEAVEEEMDAPAADDVFATGEIAPLTDMPAGDTGELSDFPEPEPDWALDEDLPVDERERSIAERDFVVRSSNDVFSRIPTLPATGSGVPILPSVVVEAEAERVESDVQAYLEAALADYVTPDVPFVRKERGRAGSTEYRSFLLQAGAAGTVASVIILGGILAFLLTNATTRRLLFAPTDIPTSTPTNTPTATPGVTNTPSPTPLVPATETPALPFQATLGFDDPNFPPTPTEAYYPDDNLALSVPDEIFVLINEGDYEPVEDILATAIFQEEETGAFPPIYRLSELYLLQGDSDEAREVVVEWEQEWRNRSGSVFANNESLYLIALARVDVYEARNGIGNRFELLDNAQARLESSLGLSQPLITEVDRLNPEGYILLSEVYRLRGDVEGALQILSDALQQSNQQGRLLENTSIRMQAARILAEERRYPEALQELYFVLEFDPFLEEALLLQIELALESGQAGLGVLYAQQYLLYYPGSLEGLYLLGQAREAESKFDLALNAYSRAVAGDVENEEYISDPFFLDNLLSRATLLNRQGQEEAAAEDFALAVELAGNNASIRARSLPSLLAAGEYEQVISDAESLLGDNSVDQSQVNYYLGIALIEQIQAGQGSNANYARAANALDTALSRGLSSLLRADAQENLALAQLETSNFEAALSAIEDALEDQFSAERVYIRGQIYDGQGETELALYDYEFVVTWGQYFNFPFLDDALADYQSAANRSGLR